jgi:hypothetical protein
MSYSFFENVAQVIFEQKEYVDGSGYPGGLTGEKMSDLGKVLSLILDYTELRFGIVTGTFLNHEQAIKVIQGNEHRYETSLIPALSSLTLEVEFLEDLSEMVLPLYSLRENMVLNKDIFADNQILLLPKDSVLTEKSIGQFMNIERNVRDKMLVSVRYELKS